MDDVVSTIVSHLIADVRGITKKPIGFPSDAKRWAFIEGPLLDRRVCRALDNQLEVVDLPAWLAPLGRVGTLSPNSLRALRTLCLYLYKLEQPYTQEQLIASRNKFVATDEQLTYVSCSRKPRLVVEASRLVRYVLRHTDLRDLSRGAGTLCSHGPGATYPKSLHHDRSCFRAMYSSIQSIWPMDAWFSLPGFWYEDYVLSDPDITCYDKIRCSLVFVPKDSRGPRTICVHPKEAIWIQQGIRRKLEIAISNDCLTKQSIRFDDQSYNQRLAYEASLSRSFCTLDLSDASDRISLDLITDIFGDMAKYLIACRADVADLDDGSSLVLRKYAPMGNATTFPIESIVFWALALAAIRLSGQAIRPDEVIVFGDDIIVPTSAYDCVIQALESVGLLVNRDKSFARGFFRESCGVDAWKGFNVTPVRLKRYDPHHPEGAAAICSSAHRAATYGFRQVASFLYRSVSAHTNITVIDSDRYEGLTYIQGDCPDLEVHYPKSFIKKRRWNSNYQCQEQLVRRVHSRSYRPKVDARWHLFDSLQRLNSAEVTESLQYASPYRVTSTYGWAPCA